MLYNQEDRNSNSTDAGIWGKWVLSMNWNILGGALVKHSKPLPTYKVSPVLLLTTCENEGKRSTRSWADCQVLPDELEIGAAHKWDDLFLLYLSHSKISTSA